MCAMNAGRMRLDSKWSLPPTEKQCVAIARLCIAHRINEPLESTVKTRYEARRVIYDLRRTR